MDAEAVCEVRAATEALVPPTANVMGTEADVEDDVGAMDIDADAAAEGVVPLVEVELSVPPTSSPIPDHQFCAPRPLMEEAMLTPLNSCAVVHGAVGRWDTVATFIGDLLVSVSSHWGEKERTVKRVVQVAVDTSPP